MNKAVLATQSNGDVEVSQEYFDGEDTTTLVRTFRQVGHYVYQVHPNGNTNQTCEGLHPTGPTLMGGDDLASVIRKTLG